MGKGTFMKGKMLAKALQAVEAGWIPEQVWMKSARRVEADAMVPRKVKKTRQAEDKYIDSYLMRHPDSEFIALDIASKDHPARIFAERQMEVLKQLQLSDRKLARDIVEAELGLEAKLKEECMVYERKVAVKEGRRMPSTGKSVLQEVREEEMKHHLAGLKKMKRQYDAASTECIIPFTEAFPEAKRWDERDQGAIFEREFGGRLGG